MNPDFDSTSSEWIKAEQAKVTLGSERAAGGNVGKWLGIGCGIPIALIVIFIFMATFWPQDDNLASTGSSKYTQTWGAAYSDTSCSDWNELMSSTQQFAAAADTLTSARNKIDGGIGLPPDSLISEFQAGITNVCVVPTMTLTDATYGLYLTEPRFHP